MSGAFFYFMNLDQRRAANKSLNQEPVRGKGVMPEAVRGYELVITNARKFINGLYRNGIDPYDGKRRWYRVRRGDRGYVPEGLYEEMFPNFEWEMLHTIKNEINHG